MQFVTSLLPSVRAEAKAREKRCEMFDKQFNINTLGYIHYTNLKVNKNFNQHHAASYFGSDPKYFRDSIRNLNIDYRQFVFIDFGSGKGRVILLATEFPFKSIIGVEFSEELCKIAQDNICSFNSDIDKVKVETVCMDASEFPLPKDCLVCYFFNPFDATIMAQVLSNINNSLLENPREIFIVYANPIEGDLFDQADCFRRVGTFGPVRIWRTMMETGNKE
jgi:SAM-dependent methyltransferase